MLFSIFDESGRVPTYNGVFGEIFTQDTTSCNDTSLFNCTSGHYEGLATYPNIIFYDCRFARGAALLNHWDVCPGILVISVKNRAVGTHHDVTSYGKVARYVTIDS